MTEQDVRGFFDEFEVAALQLQEGKGEATVEFKDRETLVRCVGGGVLL